MPPRLLAFSGSLRRDSFNHKLVEIAARGARAAGAEVTVIRLSDFPLPIFNEDDEKATGMHPNAKALKKLFKEHQGLLISSPEYNSGYSAALKNAIDWVSRSEPGESAVTAYQGKVAGILAASPGALGGLRGLVVLRMLLGNLGVVVAPEQIAVSRAHEAFDATGALKDEKTRTTVEGIGRRTAELAALLAGGAPIG